MNKNKKMINALLISTMMLSNVAPVALAAAETADDNVAPVENVHRIEGNNRVGKNRVGTSIKLSEEAYAKGTAETVVVAGFNGEVDALTGTLLATANNAPLLFVSNKDADIDLVNEEIERLGAKTVYVLGGKDVVSEEVKGSLKGETVERVEGKDRWGTAIEVAKKVGSKTGRAFVTSDGAGPLGTLADALATGPASGIENSPILLTSQGKLSSSTKKAFKDLGITDVVVIGGDKAVSDDVLQEIKDAGVNVEDRVYGNDRWETAEAIAEKYFPEAEAAIVANDTKYADAIVGGYFGVKENAPILLTNTNKLSAATKNFLGKDAVSTGYILGGTSVVSADVEDEMEVILTPAEPIEFAVEKVEVKDATTIVVTFEDVEEPVEFTVDEMTHGENEVEFTYNGHDYVATVNYEDTSENGLELNKPYIASDGMTVNVTSIQKEKGTGSTKYTVSYILKNETSDKKIDEDTFKIFFEDGTSLPQYGFFGSLFPGETLNRSYTFEFLNAEIPTLIEYGSDFFATEPSQNTLKWNVN